MHVKSIGLIVILACTMAFCAKDTVVTSATYKAKKPEWTTVKSDNFVFSYTVSEKKLAAKVSYPATGWVAVGFNPQKFMKGANFILGTRINNVAVVSDDYGTGWFSHKPDTSIGGTYNITNGDCTIANGLMTVSFTIPLNSGDNKDVIIERGKPMKIIFAAGKKNDLKSKHNAISKTTITF